MGCLGELIFGAYWLTALVKLLSSIEDLDKAKRLMLLWAYIIYYTEAPLVWLLEFI